MLNQFSQKEIRTIIILFEQYAETQDELSLLVKANSFFIDSTKKLAKLENEIEKATVDGIAIHCTDKKYIDKLDKLFITIGATWKSGGTFRNKTQYNEHGKYTVYFLEKKDHYNIITYQSVDHAKYKRPTYSFYTTDELFGDLDE